jgi:hypothetical protein
MGRVSQRIFKQLERPVAEPGSLRVVGVGAVRVHFRAAPDAGTSATCGQNSHSQYGAARASVEGLHVVRRLHAHTGTASIELKASTRLESSGLRGHRSRGVPPRRTLALPLPPIGNSLYAVSFH